MKRFVVYHSVAQRSEPNKSMGKPFEIFTKKPVTCAMGGRIWLISGRGSPTSFRLHYVFTADNSGPVEDGSSEHRVWGAKGLRFDPPISLNSEPWFAELRKTRFWGLGLQQVSSSKVIAGLLALMPATSLASPFQTLPALADIEAQLLAEVSESKNLNPAERLRRLSKAPRIPESFQVITTAYRRNPNVIAEALRRAKGRCEKCGSPAPFIRKSDGTQYLEVHHWTPLSEAGEDTVENAGALCPNCHREAHHG